MPRIDSTLSQIASRNGQPSTMPAFSHASKRSHDNTANGFLPIVHAFGALVVTFCSVGLIAIGFELPVKIPLIAAGAAGIVAMCLSGYWMVKKDILLTKEDIDGPTPAQPPQPQGKPDVWPIEMHDPERPNNLDWVNFKTEELRLAAIKASYRMSQGTAFSEGALTAGNLKITRDQFYDLRDLFFERGWCYWRDPGRHTQGISFNRAGRRVLASWATLYLQKSTPPPRISTPRSQELLPPADTEVGEWEEEGDWQEGEPDEE